MLHTTCFTKRKRNATYLFALFLVVVLCSVSPNFKSNHTPSTNSSTDLRAAFLDVVPHSVYFDRRPQSSHDNATVIFVSLSENYRGNIVGCEVDGTKNMKHLVVDIAIKNFIDTYFPVTHMDCFVYCYDMNIQEDSRVSVIYEKNGTVFEEPVRSAVVIPRYDVEEEDIMLCAAGFGVVPHLDQWLTYQKTVGIKFIHINVHPSFLENLKKSSVLQNFIESGYVNMIVWEEYLNTSQVYYYSQSLKYHDCILRYQGKYKYMMVIDFDEYFIPLDNSTKVLSYAKNLIKGNFGSVIFSRQEYYCKARASEAMAMPRDGNLTKLYNTSLTAHDNPGKSVHLVKAIIQNSVHSAGVMLHPYEIMNLQYNSRSSHCYVAHITTKPNISC